MMTIDKFNFAGKKAIVRVDFNVPLDENGKIDAAKSDMILYNSFNNTYISLGDIVGKAWVEGKKYL